MTQSNTPRFILKVLVEKWIRFGMYVSIIWLKDSTEYVSRHWVVSKDYLCKFISDTVKHSTYSAELFTLSINVCVMQYLCQHLDGMWVPQCVLAGTVVWQVAGRSAAATWMISLRNRQRKVNRASLHVYTSTYIQGIIPYNGQGYCLSGCAYNLQSIHSSSWPNTNVSWCSFLTKAHHP